MSKLRIKGPRYSWQPLRQGIVPLTSPDDAWVAEVARRSNQTKEQVLQHQAEEERQSTYWINDIYQVTRRVFADGKSVQLTIRRRDGGPSMRDWRHFQQIKNELLGPECEAIELYPAESRKVDTSNKYHLWGWLDPTHRVPVGIWQRDVSYESGKEPGSKQRPE